MPVKNPDPGPDPDPDPNAAAEISRDQPSSALPGAPLPSSALELLDELDMAKYDET